MIITEATILLKQLCYKAAREHAYALISGGRDQKAAVPRAGGSYRNRYLAIPRGKPDCVHTQVPDVAKQVRCRSKKMQKSTGNKAQS